MIDENVKGTPIDKIDFDDMSKLAENGIATQLGNNGLAVVGKGGTAKAGERGVAVVGDNGTASIGQWGVAYAGDKGTAYSGSNTVNVGQSNAYGEGDGAVAIVLEEGQAKVFRTGIAFCGNSGTAIAGDSSIAITFHGKNRTSGKASGGNGSIIIFGVKGSPDTNDIQFHIGVIGNIVSITPDLIANKLYKMDDANRCIVPV